MVLIAGGVAHAGDPVSRVCVERDGTIVVENDCGCNDALRCSELIDQTVKVNVTTDPNRMRMCRDCFAMIPGRCAIPPAANGRVEVVAGSLRVAVELANGKPLKRVCTKK